MTKPKMETRDYIWIGTLVVGLVASYAGIAAKIEVLTERVAVMDDRIWQLQGRTLTASFAVEPCPADATFVALR